MKTIITGILVYIGLCLVREIQGGARMPYIVLVGNLPAQRYGSLLDLLTLWPLHILLKSGVFTTNRSFIFGGARVVIHLAASTAAADNFTIRKQVEQTNFIDTQKVLEVCTAFGSSVALRFTNPI